MDEWQCTANWDILTEFIFPKYKTFLYEINFKIYKVWKPGPAGIEFET